MSGSLCHILINPLFFRFVEVFNSEIDKEAPRSISHLVKDLIAEENRGPSTTGPPPISVSGVDLVCCLQVLGFG